MKENALEVNRDDLCSGEEGWDLSFLIALLKASRLDLNITVIFTGITCPGVLEPEGNSKILILDYILFLPIWELYSFF